ncbi:putative glycosyl transferase [Blastochloris viridis]|uniref:Putative glycosyl transferase n=2 Tax=Blastochloris viridis TaxID=1079 RepID=A0A0H5BPG4_BLAVI|nr:putative glycosyl transferase [Blastochloris viridis]BAR99243.1 succinoglycan biosynthesis protein exoM [Blastochloris viridis]CUU43450.1 putative glycosyl transferase [Blastochloris viridis]
MTCEPALELSIVICTFKRERLLRRAIASVARQACPAGVDLILAVVDNSDDGEAAAAVEAMREACPFELRYVAAHPPNISVARNAGIAATTSPFVAFIDDDTELAEGWVEAVVGALREHPYDILFGAIEPVFEAPSRAPSWTHAVYSRRLAAATGRELSAMGRGKTRDVALSTSNAVLRRATTLTDAEPFDRAFGNGGGEDYDLFCRVQRRGCRFGWVPGALVREEVPAERCDTAYLRRRMFAGGQAFAMAIAKNSRWPAATRWWLRGKAAVQALYLASVLPLRLWRGGEALDAYSCAWAGVLGKLAFGEIHPIYRAPAAARS